MEDQQGSILEQIQGLESELAELWKKLSDPRYRLREERLSAVELIAGGSRYLVAIEAVREVIQMLLPQPLADAPPWVLGTFQYGQQTVPLIDLKRRMGGGATEVDPDLVVVVLDSPTWLGLVVDAVGEVMSLDVRTLSAPHAGIPQAPFLIGTLPGDGGEAIHLLSVTGLTRELE
jgi:chemotaxis signal transduction protein